jgi:hypothetical protein
MEDDARVYPELNRSLRLVPKDTKLAMDPYVVRYLDVLAEELQPILDEAMKTLSLEVLATGCPQKPVLEYVSDLLVSIQIRRELKVREAMWTRFYGSEP